MSEPTDPNRWVEIWDQFFEICRNSEIEHDQDWECTPRREKYIND